MKIQRTSSSAAAGCHQWGPAPHNQLRELKLTHFHIFKNLMFVILAQTNTESATL